MNTLVELKLEDVKTVKELNPYSDEAAVLYEIGATNTDSIIVRDRETGVPVCGYSRKPAAEVMAENPNLKLVTFGSAWKACEAAQIEKYVGPWEEITKERFWEMLEVLPPKRWRTHQGVEYFAMSEFTTGNLTGFFARLKERYFEATRDYYTASDAQIAREVAEAAKNLEREVEA